LFFGLDLDQHDRHPVAHRAGGRAGQRRLQGGQTIDAGVGSVDSDRNVNWTFPARGTVVIIR